jgi:hypothetical protein
MQGIFDLLKIEDIEVLNNTLDAMIKIAEINHKHMRPHLPRLQEETQRMIVKANTAGDMELSKVAQYCIEIWCTLFETELEQRRSPGRTEACSIIQGDQWNELATMFLNGLMSITLDISDTQIDDETDQSISDKCCAALAFLSQLAGDGMLELTFQFVNQYLQHSTQAGTYTWITNFVALSALNSSVEGMSAQALQQRFTDHISWVYERAQASELKV